MSNQSERDQVNNVFHTTTKADLIKYLHQAAFSPVKATWKKAIENGHFITWPGGNSRSSGEVSTMAFTGIRQRTYELTKAMNSTNQSRQMGN